MSKNPLKHKFAYGDFTSFSMEVSASSHNFRFGCLHFTFQICQIDDSSISWIFWISFMAGFCDFAQLCGVTWRNQAHQEEEMSLARQITCAAYSLPHVHRAAWGTNLCAAAALNLCVHRHFVPYRLCLLERSRVGRINLSTTTSTLLGWHGIAAERPSSASGW